MTQADPGILTIIGITGDLARRKLLPALLHLEKDSLLSDKFYIIGSTRRDIDSNSYRERIKEELEINDDVGERFLERIHIIQADLTKDNGLDNLNERLDAVEHESGMCMQRLFYLAVPPNAYEDVVASLGSRKVHKCHDGRQGRLLIEKPFGSDLQSAQSLSKVVAEYFDEENIFRIDHYLAKETVQNLLSFRFHNPIFHDLWSSSFIGNVQISALEQISVKGRVGFYEQTGALRDVIQSHLLQLLALTAMEQPETMDAQDVRAGRLELLKSIKPAKHGARGQYKGYEDDIEGEASLVETFAAIEIEIDNDRWRGIPIYLRTGKSMKKKVTEISLIYSDPTLEDCPDNVLSFRIQPGEGIALNLQAKKPGLGHQTQDIVMDYLYSRSQDTISHGAYEKLLIDAMEGDQKLFPSTEEVLESWRIVDEIVEKWSKNDEGLETYRVGSWGPDNSVDLLARNGHSWIIQELSTESEAG